jgi:hypothetical protein
METASRVTTKSPSGHRSIKPYSRLFSKSVSLELQLDGRSREGKFARRLELELREHVGPQPTVVQILAIKQAVRLSLQINTLNAKLMAGSFTDHDRRAYAAFTNGYRLLLRELGVGATARANRSTPTTGISDLVATHRERP